MSGGKYFHTNVRYMDMHTLLFKCVDEFIVWKVQHLCVARCLLSIFGLHKRRPPTFTLALFGSVGEFDNMDDGSKGFNIFVLCLLAWTTQLYASLLG